MGDSGLRRTGSPFTPFQDERESISGVRVQWCTTGTAAIARLSRIETLSLCLWQLWDANGPGRSLV